MMIDLLSLFISVATASFVFWKRFGEGGDAYGYMPKKQASSARRIDADGTASFSVMTPTADDLAYGDAKVITLPLPPRDGVPSFPQTGKLILPRLLEVGDEILADVFFDGIVTVTEIEHVNSSTIVKVEEYGHMGVMSPAYRPTLVHRRAK